ncbi:MAG: DUF1361 domain-containing protein [Gammaproteobacteria bacterium]|nr:DUF1361 domain-containing protein [Gammaproteobacteria bacterium]
MMAIAGLICGFASIEILHNFWKAQYKSTVAWILVSISFVFGIYGVYIGRFLRLNSWDLIDSPLIVLHEIWNMTLSNG